MIISKIIPFAALMAMAVMTQGTFAQVADSVLTGTTVKARRAATVKDSRSVQNTDIISRAELQRFACCNLGESFTANPSVDVSYSDASTGAKQIKLLGLSGTYVQMLTEQVPAFRILASPWALGYVPGTWMQDIQVSKGISSVKQGYEGITGQINIDYLKPNRPEPQWFNLNLYGDLLGRVEANADATLPINSNLGTTILAHYENETTQHDSNNDGYMDSPMVEQAHLMNRWTFQNSRFHSEIAVKGLWENRTGGQVTHGHHRAHLASDITEPHRMQSDGTVSPYRINIETKRAEAFSKNSLMLGHHSQSSIALILAGSFHDQDSYYGLRMLDAHQWNGYASLLYDLTINDHHSLSAGLSYNYDGLLRHSQLQRSLTADTLRSRDHETTYGSFAQYTWTPTKAVSAVIGARVDHSDLWGTFFTPRMHVKFQPAKLMSIRLSGGKGYRTAYALDENSNLLAGSRAVMMEVNRFKEEAWNAGINWTWKLPVAGRLLTLSAEYYYTDFLHQMVVDMDSDPHAIAFYQLNGRSYSHVAQVEASWQPIERLDATLAFRYTDSQSTYGGVRREKPLQSRYKGVLSLSYKTPLERWQFDFAAQLNGPGRMPVPYYIDNVGNGGNNASDGTLSWRKNFHAWEQLSLQVSRMFRRLTIYVGGENLTAFRQRHPIIAAASPWSDRFDPTMVYGPTHGARIYMGLRFALDKD